MQQVQHFETPLTLNSAPPCSTNAITLHHEDANGFPPLFDEMHSLYIGFGNSTSRLQTHCCMSTPSRGVHIFSAHPHMPCTCTRAPKYAHSIHSCGMNSRIAQSRDFRDHTVPYLDQFHDFIRWCGALSAVFCCLAVSLLVEEPAHLQPYTRYHTSFALSSSCCQRQASVSSNLGHQFQLASLSLSCP